AGFWESVRAALVDPVMIEEGGDGGLAAQATLLDEGAGKLGGIAEGADLRAGCCRIAGERGGNDVRQGTRQDIGARPHAFENDADRNDLVLVDHHRFGGFVFPGVERFKSGAEQLLQSDGRMSFVKVWQEIHHLLSPWRKGDWLHTPD